MEAACCLQLASNKFKILVAGSWYDQPWNTSPFFFFVLLLPPFSTPARACGKKYPSPGSQVCCRRCCRLATASTVSVVSSPPPLLSRHHRSASSVSPLPPRHTTFAPTPSLLSRHHRAAFSVFLMPLLSIPGRFYSTSISTAPSSRSS